MLGFRGGSLKINGPKKAHPLAQFGTRTRQPRTTESFNRTTPIVAILRGRSCWEGGGPGLGVLFDGHRLQGCAVRFLGESAGQEQRRRASGPPWNPAEVRSQTARISDGVKKTQIQTLDMDECDLI